VVTANDPSNLDTELSTSSTQLVKTFHRNIFNAQLYIDQGETAVDFLHAFSDKDRFDADGFSTPLNSCPRDRGSFVEAKPVQLNN
jgi:hypothetical protein